jgi:hypothetical protein
LGQTKVIFSKHSETYGGESESGHGESVEHFDQTVGLSIHDLDILSWFSRLLFKPAGLLITTPTADR